MSIPFQDVWKTITKFHLPVKTTESGDNRKILLNSLDEKSLKRLDPTERGLTQVAALQSWYISETGMHQDNKDVCNFLTDFYELVMTHLCEAGQCPLPMPPMPRNTQTMTLVEWVTRVNNFKNDMNKTDKSITKTIKNTCISIYVRCCIEPSDPERWHVWEKTWITFVDKYSDTQYSKEKIQSILHQVFNNAQKNPSLKDWMTTVVATLAVIANKSLEEAERLNKQGPSCIQTSLAMLHNSLESDWMHATMKHSLREQIVMLDIMSIMSGFESQS